MTKVRHFAFIGSDGRLYFRSSPTRVYRSGAVFHGVAGFSTLAGKASPVVEIPAAVMKLLREAVSARLLAKDPQRHWPAQARDAWVSWQDVPFEVKAALDVLVTGACLCPPPTGVAA